MDKRIYIIGAGFAGQTIADDIKRKKIFGKVNAFIDDNKDLIGTTIDGIPVLGPISGVTSILSNSDLDEAIIAIPSAPTERIREIYETLTENGFNHIKILPGISQVIEGTAHLVQTREIDPLDIHLDRPDSSRNPFVSKYLAETLYYNLTAPKFIGALQGNADTASNASKVNGHTVNADVPANAKFTDTVPTTTQSKTTGITASTTATKTTLGTAFTIPNVTSAGSASTWAFEEVSIPNVTAAGSASTWAFEDITCDDITSWSAGSGSASISGAVDANDSTQLNITISHTHTAPSLQYTARTISSKKSGGNGTAPTLGTAIKVQSKKSGANGSAPTLGTAFTVPNVTGNTNATVSITDSGHTHSI